MECHEGFGQYWRFNPLFDVEFSALSFFFLSFFISSIKVAFTALLTRSPFSMHTKYHHRSEVCVALLSFLSPEMSPPRPPVISWARHVRATAHCAVHGTRFNFPLAGDSRPSRIPACLCVVILWLPSSIRSSEQRGIDSFPSKRQSFYLRCLFFLGLPKALQQFGSDYVVITISHN